MIYEEGGASKIITVRIYINFLLTVFNKNVAVIIKMKFIEIITPIPLPSPNRYDFNITITELQDVMGYGEVMK